jgi:4-hydroxy-tetrahydrodipicolinate reductase
LSEIGKETGVQVLIAGSGKLANELLKNLNSPSIKSVLPWSQRDTIWHGRRIIVHAGSGREIENIVTFCSPRHLTLVELSTTGHLENVHPEFPVVICPNTNILILKFMAMLQSQGHLFSEHEIEILESHQADKKSEPGTAISMAESLGMPKEKIISVRDPLIQERRIGIPPEHLARHAYHRIRITDGNVGIVMETRVSGQAPYASGLARIVEGICKRDLEPGKHEILKLIRNGWI